MRLNTNKVLSFFIFSFVFSLFASAESVKNIEQIDFSKTISFESGDTLFLIVDSVVTDSLSQKVDSNKEKNKKKIISAFFAFPFPLGFMGAHRVMLGTKPWVPVVYVATFGGCFGVLPLIDFFVITFAKDIEQYENNPNIFMWLK
ncbi:MAG TPA: NINE protein [Bacteroidia bacterium]|nr:NINE protein [Bacteroidia bacterium]